MTSTPATTNCRRNNGASCFCFGAQMSRNPESDQEMDKNSSARNKKPPKHKTQTDTADEAISSGGSFYSLIQGESINNIPGPKAIPGKTFKMGESIPHAHHGVSGTTWSHANHEFFKVRMGPNYHKTGNKEPSLSFLYESVGVDILRGDQILTNIAPHLLFPPPPDYYNSACNLPVLIIVNAQLPLAMPSLFSSSDSDPGWSCVGYYRIKQETVDWAVNPATAPPAMNVLIRLIQKGFSERSLAFKAIGMVHDIEKQDLPMMNLISKYNGKPVLVTASSQFSFGNVPYPYLEVDYNVRKWSLAARTTLVQLGDRLKTLTAHIGYLVEATDDCDLPERMLGATTVHNLSIDNAKWVKFD